MNLFLRMKMRKMMMSISLNLTRKVCSTMVLNELNKKVDLIIRSNGNKILTSSRKAVSIALIVNELVQNSLKHAFPEDKQGEIIVNFLFDDRLFGASYFRQRRWDEEAEIFTWIRNRP